MSGERLRVISDHGLVLDLDDGSDLIIGFIGHVKSALVANFIARREPGSNGYGCEVIDAEAKAIFGLSAWRFSVDEADAPTPLALGQAALERVAEHYKIS